MGIYYIQLISIAYILLLHIPIPISQKKMKNVMQIT